jgi:hypothetical protein
VVDPTGWVDSDMPVNLAAPSVSGDGVVGQILTCAPGTWGGYQLDVFGGPMTFTYQWQRLVSGAWLNISGANGATYSPVLADAGNDLRCMVMAWNAATTNAGYPAPPAVSASVLVDIPAPLTVPVASMQRQHRGPKWFRDLDGIWDAEKQYEGIETDVQDWSDALGGETITSIVVATDGIIINSSSNTDTTTTVTVTGVGAYHIDITTSAGRMVRVYFRYRRLHRPLLGIMDGGGGIDSDYR